MNKRLQSIDFIRGIAVVAMIQTHIWEYYIIKPSGWGLLLLNWLVGPLGGYAAPLFILVAGLSAHFSVLSLSKLGPADRRPSYSKFFIRGGFLFVLSTAINVVVGPILHVLPVSVLNWSTIQLIGFCLFLVPFFVRLGWIPKVLWLAAPLILSEWHYLGGLSIPHLSAGFSPPLPWAFLFFAGLVVGEGYTLALEKLSFRRLLLLALVGCLLTGPIALLSHSFYRPFDPNHATNPSITSISVFLGIFLLLVATCGYLLDWRESRRPALAVRIIAGWGQHSLSIYYLQLAGIVGSAIVLRTLTGDAVRVDWLWFVPLLVLALLLVHVIVDVVWSRFDYALSLEWFFGKLVVTSSRAGQGDRQAARP